MRFNADNKHETEICVEDHKPDLLITLNLEEPEAEGIKEEFGKEITHTFKKNLECAYCGKKGSYVIKDSNHFSGACRECLSDIEWIEEIEEL